MTQLLILQYALQYLDVIPVFVGFFHNDDEPNLLMDLFVCELIKAFKKMSRRIRSGQSVFTNTVKKERIFKQFYLTHFSFNTDFIVLSSLKRTYLTILRSTKCWGIVRDNYREENKLATSSN